MDTTGDVGWNPGRAAADCRLAAKRRPRLHGRYGSRARTADWLTTTFSLRITRHPTGAWAFSPLADCVAGGNFRLSISRPQNQMKREFAMETDDPISVERFVVRNTNAKRGRTRSISPGETAARHLQYGRVILEAADAPVRFSNGEHETCLICLKGNASVNVEGNYFKLARYDSLYIPRDTEVEVSTGDACDLAEISAPVTNRYPLQLVRFADVQRDGTLHFKAGGATAEREVNILIGKNVEAGRLLAGITFSKPGNWTSWPPHEHAAMLEEAYLYVDMPAPAWGIQLVYTDPAQPELVAVVREGDCVLMPKGYHPNVAAPGGAINFLWMMAANRETDDRLFGVVNVHPDFAQGGSGLDPGRATPR